MKRFSIVIPALNEASVIGETIAAARAQNIPRNSYEVIVVDNGSTDGTANAARAADADRVIIEPQRGTNVARNRGYRESTGEILAFLDADCLPPPGWLRTIERELSHPGVAGVSGPYDFGFTGIRKAADYLWTHVMFAFLAPAMTFLFRKPSGVILGGNFGVRRSTIDAIGGIPPLTFWGDDTATAILIARRVGKVVFTPRLIIKSSPRRFKSHGLISTTLRYAYHHFRVYFSREYW
ncbi:MAG: glycosyltransferase [Patescibacteria group bacterium]